MEVSTALKWGFVRYFIVLTGALLLLSSAPGIARAQDEAPSPDGEETSTPEGEPTDGEDAASDDAASDEAAEAGSEEAAAAQALIIVEDRAAAYEEASEELASELDHRSPPSPEGVSTPGDDTGDWIQINSGEWLRGEITVLRDDVLVFDSEELDDQSFDWANIVQLRSPNVNRYVRNFEEVHAGLGVVDLHTVTVETDEGTQSFPRSELTAILGGEDTEASRWTGFVGMGFDGNWGASEQISLSASASVTREDASTRLKLSYDAAWGQSTGTVNVNNMWARLRFDVFISSLFYLTPLSGPLGYDKFLNLELRAAPGSGAGIHIIDIPYMDWDVDAAMAYVYTRFASVMAGEDDARHDAGVRLSTFYSWDITGDIEFDAKHESLLVVTAMGLTQFTTQATLSVDLTGDLDLDLMFRHTRIREPQPLEDGTIPDDDQFQLTIGLGWDI